MKYFKIVINLLPVFLLAFLFLYLPRIIKINKISCSNQYGVCSDFFLAKIKDFEKKSLFAAKKDIKSYFNNQSAISEYSQNYKFPDRLVIYLIEEKAKYALRYNIQNLFVVADEDGKVLRIQDSSNLPYIVTNKNPKNVGEIVTSEEKFALDIIYDLSASYQVRSGILINDSLTVELPTGLTVIFPLRGDRSVLLSSLSLILEKLNSGVKDSKIEKVKNVRLLDLRYKNPIIKYY